jgi:hypothetical protein
MPGHEAPAVRVGLHHGSAIERVATGREVLLTAQAAALVPELEGVFYESRGREAPRNVREPVNSSPRCVQGRRLRANSSWTRFAGWH